MSKGLVFRLNILFSLTFFKKNNSVHCIWSDWGPCSVSCGNGIQARHWQKEAQNGGEKCDGNSIRNCSLHTLSKCPGYI